MASRRRPLRLALAAVLLLGLLPAGAWAGADGPDVRPEAGTGGPPSVAPASGLRSLDQLAALPDAVDLRGRRPTGVADRLGASADGDRVRLVVALPEVFVPEGLLDGDEVTRQHGRLRAAQARLLRELGAVVRGHRSFEGFVPHVEIEVDAHDVDRVVGAASAAAVEPVTWSSADLEQSSLLVGADSAAQLGFDGSGTAVGILDSGVDSSHEFLAGRVVAEACFSSQASCPNGSTSQTGRGAAAPCTYAPSACEHGTHVAGIAAGRGASWSGVAPGADVVAVQVFSRFDGDVCTRARASSPCSLSSSSDQIAALGHLADLAADVNLAAVNVSIGSDDEVAVACDSQATSYAAAISQLASKGVAVVISSGNSGHDAGVGFPACLSQAITVGNTTKSDAVAVSSNHAGLVDLLAPGSQIVSSTPGNAYKSFTGTSMAAPHVAGALAVLRQRAPDATVDELLAVLAETGVSVGDARNTVVRPRIRVDAALLALTGDREAEGDPPPSGGLCPTDDWRELGEEQSWAVVNGRTEYGVICAGDDDWFAFPGGAGGSVTVQLDFDHAAGDLDLQLWNATEVQLTSDSTSDGERIDATVNTSDTYYARVYGFESAENDYELTVTYTSCPPDDVYEPNDDTTDATVIAGTTLVFGEACAGDLDVFRVDLVAGESIAAEAFFLHRFGDVDVRLYDPELTVVSASVSVDDDEYVNYTAAGSGPHYVTVEGYDGAANSYALHVVVGDLCPGNDPYEPNDDQLAAMELGQIVSGVACSSEVDFFGVDLVEGSSLDVDLLFTHANGDLDLHVFDPDGTLAATADSVTDDESASVVADATGTWIISVSGFDGASNTYQLLTEGFLGNDDRADALAITTAEGMLEGTNEDATREPDEPEHAGVPTAGSVWYRWTVPTAGLGVVHTHGSDVDTVLAVYRELQDGTLDEVAANDDVSDLLTSHSGHFVVAAGDEFLIAVDTYGSGSASNQGTFQLHWRVDDDEAADADPDDAGAADPGEVAWSSPRARRVAETCDGQQSTGFDDVPDGNVHDYAIRCIAGYEISIGRGDGTYNPSGTLTVGQTATFLVRTLAEGGADAPPANGACGDDDRTHIEAIERLVAAGVLTADDCARLNVLITRAGMAQMVHDALVGWGGLAPPTETADRDYYTDDDGHAGEGAIDAITALGIVTGRGDGTFRPEANLSRAQMGTFLARCIDALQDLTR